MRALSFRWVAIYKGLGDIQKALEYLNRARDEGSSTSLTY